MATTSKAPATPARKTAPAAKAGSNHASNGRAAEPARAEEPNIGLERKDMDETCKLLNDVLANYQVLAVKTKNYHWNVVGMQFMSLHIFLEKMYGFLTQEADEIAERARTLGGRPLGNMATFIQRATLDEETREGIRSIDMLKTLLKDEEELIRQMRDMP